jgi:hypothetical protein
MKAFEIVGVCLFVYCLLCLFSGEVYAKDKWSGRTVLRSEQPVYFFVVIGCYLTMAAACFFVF